MNKLLSGISLMFFGIILFCIAHIQSSHLYIKLGSWNTPPGKYLTSVIETGGLLPFISGLFLMFLGLTFVLYGALRNK